MVRFTINPTFRASILIGSVRIAILYCISVIMKKGLLYLHILFLMSFSAFAQQPTQTLFKPVPANESGINFANIVKESPELNIISYEYFYNGGGVGLGDFNNDGLTDIYFSGNMQPGKLYLNRGNLKFEDITAKAGVAGKKDGRPG